MYAMPTWRAGQLPVARTVPAAATSTSAAMPAAHNPLLLLQFTGLHWSLGKLWWESQLLRCDALWPAEAEGRIPRL